jgi:hypothetical protein
MKINRLIIGQLREYLTPGLNEKEKLEMGDNVDQDIRLLG